MAGGRPLGSENKDKPFRDMLRRLVAEAGTDRDALRDVGIALIAKARSGDIPAIKEFADRLDGKVPQSTEITGADGGPIQTEDMTDIERARRVAFMLAKGAQEAEKE